MGCELSKVYNIEIHLENENGIYNPTEDVTGHVLIQVDEDTVIHNCSIMCFGLVRTRWKSSATGDSGVSVAAGSLAVGMNTLLNSRKSLSSRSDDIFNSGFFRKPSDVESTMANGLLGNVPNRGHNGSSTLTLMADVFNTDFESLTGPPISYPQKLSRINGYELDSIILQHRIEYPENPLETAVKRVRRKLRSLSSRLPSCNPEEKERIFGDCQLFYRETINLLKDFQVNSGSDSVEDTGIRTRHNSSNMMSNGDLRHSKKKFDDGSRNQRTGVNSSGFNKRPTEYIISRGIHVFNFEFNLPADLPSSFELPSACLAGGAYGRLNYGLKVAISNLDANVTHTRQVEIIVSRPLDLITLPALRDRMTMHKEFVIPGCLGLLRHMGGTIQCDLSLNKTGFVPGESILPEILIKNNTARAIQTVNLRFLQAVLLHGKEGKFHIEVLRLFATKLCENNKHVLSPKNSTLQDSAHNLEKRKSLSASNGAPNGLGFDMILGNGQAHNGNQVSRRRTTTGIPGYGSIAQFSEVIHVPPLPPTGLLGREKLIHVEYAIVLRLRMTRDKSGKNDLRVNIPITIGTEPTMETSFNLNTFEKIKPCFASFDYANGEIKEHEPKTYQERRMTEDGGHRHRYESRVAPVYKYYRSVIEKSGSVFLVSQSKLAQNRINQRSKKFKKLTKKSSLDNPHDSDDTIAQKKKLGNFSQGSKLSNPVFYLEENKQYLYPSNNKSSHKSIERSRNTMPTLSNLSLNSSCSSSEEVSNEIRLEASSCDSPIQDPLSPMSLSSPESTNKNFATKDRHEALRNFSDNGEDDDSIEESCSSCSNIPERIFNKSSKMSACSSSSIHYIKSDIDYTHGRWALQYLNKSSRSQLTRSNQLPRSNPLETEQSPLTIDEDSDFMGSI